jgi:Tfp pilus assembly protein PilP
LAELDEAAPKKDKAPAKPADKLVEKPSQKPPEKPADKPAEKPEDKPEIKPDESRVKQFLEGFSIDTFEMVGTLRNDRQLFALVSGAGGVHRVKVGDFLGRNHGKILVIDDSKIDVVEIVPDGEGGWLERPRSLSLKERS